MNLGGSRPTLQTLSSYSSATILLSPSLWSSVCKNTACNCVWHGQCSIHEESIQSRIAIFIPKLTTCYVHGTHKELDWQCLWQTSGPSECVHAELLTDVLTSWLLQKKIPWVHDRKTPSRKEGNHGSKSMCYPVELLVQRSALPFRALRTLQGVHRDGNTGKTVSTHLYKVS